MMWWSTKAGARKDAQDVAVPVWSGITGLWELGCSPQKAGLALAVAVRAEIVK